MLRSRWASTLLSFTPWSPLGPLPLSLGHRVSIGPRCSALLPRMPAAMQHRTAPNPVPVPGLGPALGTSWLAPPCVSRVLTLHVAGCSACGSMGSGTRDLASGDVGWGRKWCSPALGGSGQSRQLRFEPLCRHPTFPSSLSAGAWGWQSGFWRGKLPIPKIAMGE